MNSINITAHYYYLATGNKKLCFNVEFLSFLLKDKQNFNNLCKSQILSGDS